jgi:hypothetical protein
MTSTTNANTSLPTTPYVPGAGGATSCPNPPFKVSKSTDAPQNLKRNAPNAAPLLSALGIGQCHYANLSSSGSSTSGHLGLSGPSVSHSSWDNTNIQYANCVNVDLLAQHYSDTVNAVYCSIKESSTTMTSTFKNVNTINIIAGEDSTINFNCGAGGFTVIQGQNMDISVIDIGSLTSKETVPITQAITNGIANWANAANSPALSTATTASNAAVNLISQNLSKGTFQNDSIVDLQSLSQAEQTENTINITTNQGATINISGDSCLLSQDILVKIAIENSVTNAFVRALQGVDLPALLPPPPNTGKYKAAFWAIIIIVVLLVVGLPVYFFVIRKKSSQPKLAFSFY